MGELFPRVGFAVTNLTAASRVMVHFPNKSGTAEQWIKEYKQAVKMTRLCCHRFRAHEVRVWLVSRLFRLAFLCTCLRHSWTRRLWMPGVRWTNRGW